MENDAAATDEVLRALGVGVWEWRPQTGEMRFSPILYDILGLDPASASAESVRALVHPDDRRAVALAVEAALWGRQPFISTHRMIRPDGRVI
jgi:PAS domain-containing protein